jgi:hypothetical protein
MEVAWDTTVGADEDDESVVSGRPTAVTEAP